MPIMPWQDTYSIGIEQFDTHHKHLVELLNSFYDAVISGDSYKQTDILLNSLIDYSTYHFLAEEDWMDKNGYKGLVEHRKQHDFFIRKVTKIQMDFIAGKQNISTEILKFLVDWLSNHILISDANFGRLATIHHDLPINS